MKVYFYLMFPSLFILTFSCTDLKPTALGPDGRIVVFADSLVYRLAAPGLDKTIRQTVSTLPQPEPLFELEHQPRMKFNDLKQRAYLLILASLQDSTPTSKMARSMLSPSVLELAEKGEQNIFVIRDKYAARQLVVFVIGNTPEEISGILAADSANFTNTFTELTLNRMSLDMFRKHSNEELSDKMRDKLGFSVRFQHDYVLIRDTLGPNFFYMKRIQPDLDRWVWIHWWDNPAGDFPKKDRLIAIQDSVMKLHIQADDSSYSETVPGIITHKEVNFNGFYGIETRGTWRLNDYSMGGPFITYTFYNDSLKQLFMINGSVLAPKFPEKMKFIREMEVIAKSIRFKQGKGAVSGF